MIYKMCLNNIKNLFPQFKIIFNKIIIKILIELKQNFSDKIDLKIFFLEKK